MSEAPSLRETIESAMASATPEPEPAETTSTAAPEEAETTATAAPETTEAATADRPRDEHGRFKAKESEKAGAVEPAEKEKPVATQTQPPAQPAETATKPSPKVPQSWKASVRELAAKLPAEFHPLLEESLRRDVETQRALQESAQARQLAAQVQQTLAPYETIARANGMNAMQYAGSVLQTAAVLHMGTPQQKAALVAQLINAYQIDPEQVNAVMQGQAPTQATTQPPVNIQAEVQRALQAQVQALDAQRADSEARSFVESAPEFLKDVWQDMVELIQVAENRGQKLSYQQAYDRACRLNEDVSKILDGRKATEAAKAKASTLPKAKAAAVSVKASPVEAAPGKSGPRSLRETIEAAVAESQRT